MFFNFYEVSDQTVFQDVCNSWLKCAAIDQHLFAECCVVVYLATINDLAMVASWGLHLHMGTVPRQSVRMNFCRTWPGEAYPGSSQD